MFAFAHGSGEAPPILGMGVTGDVLVALASLRAPLSGRRIAERASVSATQAAKVLTALTDAGLVDATSAPPAILYGLNRDHVLASAVDAVVRARSAWRERLRAAVESWTLPAVAVAVFGSSATGTAGERSDIDLLVVRPEGTDADDERWSTQVAQVAQALTTWTGQPGRRRRLDRGRARSQRATGRGGPRTRGRPRR